MPLSFEPTAVDDTNPATIMMSKMLLALVGVIANDIYWSPSVFCGIVESFGKIVVPVDVDVGCELTT